ncbi:MAG: DUF2024 family protein [Saprospiraceae bacterium]|nr:MAG: DUF2024 family protein [Saprospiraceae bacterium]
MSVAVWDTYVKKRDGSVMHFDIIAPSALKDVKTIYGYGKAYLSSKNEADGKIDTGECQFCHIEEASPDMRAAIEKNGYFILEMEDVPAALPANPSRRDLVLHLRAHYARYRFANLQGKTAEELQAIIRQAGQKQ